MILVIKPNRIKLFPSINNQLNKKKKNKKKQKKKNNKKRH